MEGHEEWNGTLQKETPAGWLCGGLCLLGCKGNRPGKGSSSGEESRMLGAAAACWPEERCPAHTKSETGKRPLTQSSSGPWTSLQGLVHRAPAPRLLSGT